MNNQDFKEGVIQITQAQFPGKDIKSFEDKGVWLKHIFKITFTDESCIYIKLALHDFCDLQMESNVVELLHKNGIHQPGVLKIDTSCSLLPHPFIIQEGGTGKRLSHHLDKGDAKQLMHIYRAVGEYYSKFADIKNDWAGLWDVVPEKNKYPVHPAQAMYQLGIEQGSGHKAFSEGAISLKLYEQIKNVWQKNIPMLKERPVTLVHYSPFPWTIYISDIDCNYRVSKITALGDIIWWDADIMAAHVLYPPFYSIDDSLRRSFLDGYKKEVDDSCVRLYCILHRLCAWAGVYEESYLNLNNLWRQNCIKDVEYFLEDLL